MRYCDKCNSDKDIREHWVIAGYYCPLECQWSGFDHHSHSLCKLCGNTFEKTYTSKQKYGIQRQLDAQLLRKKKDEATHALSIITYERYRNKFNTYLYHNRKKQNIPCVVQARNKYFEWMCVNRPQDYKYHCENECCLRPLKSTHVEQVKNKIYCRSCSRTVSLKLSVAST